MAAKIKEILSDTIFVENVIWKLCLILLVLFGMRLIIKLSYSLLARIYSLSQDQKDDLGQRNRIKTIKTIFESIVRYIVYFMGVITILDIMGAPIMTVLSTAGVLGVAVGFGAQTLVKDTITGLFILIEDQFTVGDFVQIMGIEGTVEVFELRITKIRSANGELIIIPNGNISLVTNYNRGPLRAMVEINVGYDADIDLVLAALEQAAKRAEAEMGEFITDKPVITGIWAISDSSMAFRVMIKTTQRAKLNMELRRWVKEELDRVEIPLAYKTQSIILSEAAKL